MTKKTDTWMPLLVDKYLGDTTHLTTEQHGAYLLLLMSMWKKNGRLPDDNVQLANIARLSPARWRAMRAVLIDGVLLRIDGDWVVQKRLSEELERAKAGTEAKAEAGSKGAAKRWQKDGTANGKTDGTANGKTDGKQGGPPDGKRHGKAHGSANGKPDSRSNGNAIANGAQTASQNDASISLSIHTEEERLEYFHPPPGEDGNAEANAAAAAAGGGASPSAYGSIAAALKRLGIPRVSPGHPGFRALVDAGVTVEEFEAFADRAREADDAFAYLVKTVSNARKRAVADASALGSGNGGTRYRQSALEARNRAVIEEAAAINEERKEQRG